jgi:Lipocalin-like domain
MPTATELIGTWRVAGISEWDATGRVHKPLGETPTGYAVFDAGGRIFIQLSRNPADGGTTKDIAASFIAYFGTFQVSGDTLSLAIETANAPGDVASKQTRTVTQAGGGLTIGIPGQFMATLARLPVTAPGALTGAWRVQSFTRYGKDGAPHEPLGNPPAGFAVFDTTGRACIQLGKAPSAGSADDVAKSLMAYFGPCSIAGDTLSVAVESSTMAAYVGSTQIRVFNLDGDVLTLGTPGEYQAVCKHAR